MKFTAMISTPPMRNDQVNRYSGIRQTDNESLSTHLVDVQMTGYALIRTMNKFYGESIDIGLFLEKALIHDLDEVLTGDMPRSTKYYNKTLLTEMKKVADSAMLQVSERFFNDEEVYERWAASKEGKDGIMVKVVDMLCVASKTLKEVELLGNNYFLKVAYEVRGHLRYIGDYLTKNSPYTPEATEFLIGVVDEAHDEVERVWQDRKHIAENYGILENIFQGKGTVNE